MKTSSSQSNKDRLVAMFNALSNPIRFQIIEFISERHVCISKDIVASVNLAQSTVSQHLSILRDAGLVQAEIIGPATRYSINAESIRWLKDQVRHWMPEYSLPED